MSMTKDMHDNALQSALADTRPIKEVEWITEDIHDPNDYAKLGGIKHSLLKVTRKRLSLARVAWRWGAWCPMSMRARVFSCCVMNRFVRPPLSVLQLHSARSNHSRRRRRRRMMKKALTNLKSDSRSEVPGHGEQFEAAKQFLEDHAGEIEDAKEIAGEVLPFVKAGVKLIQKIYGQQRSSQQNKDIVAQILEYFRRLEDLTQKLPTDSIEYACVLTFIKDKTIELGSLHMYTTSLNATDSQRELREFYKEISKATRELEMNEKTLAKGREADKLNDHKALTDQKMQNDFEVPNDQNVSAKERTLELELEELEEVQLELKLAKAENRRKCCLASWCNFGAKLFRATAGK